MFPTGPVGSAAGSFRPSTPGPADSDPPAGGPADDGEPDLSNRPNQPDPLKPLRAALTRLDPVGFADCFAPGAMLRVPRPEGDLLIAEGTELIRTGQDLRAAVDGLTWTPSRRLVAAHEVTEEAVLVATVPTRNRSAHAHSGRTRAGRAATPASADRAVGAEPTAGAGAGAEPTAGADTATPVHSVRVPLRAVATVDPDGLLSSLTLWLDWAALRDPAGVATAAGAASVLVAAARAHDERGVQVLRAAPRPLVLPAPQPSTQRQIPLPQDRPMSAGTIWWQTHRGTLAGSVMAIATALLLGWVATALPEQQRPDEAEIAAAGPTEPSPGDGTAGLAGRTGALPAEATGPMSRTDQDASAGAAGSTRATGSTARAAGADRTGAQVLSSQAPDAIPTVQAGREITFLSDVLFEFGSFRLSERSRTRLDRLAGQIRRAEVHGVVQVNGFTDDIGGERTNLELSRARALAVARALSERLPNTDVLLRVQGFGESRPRATNRTATGRRTNRRVSVVLPVG